jgi:hypothetical protein
MGESMYSVPSMYSAPGNLMTGPDGIVYYLPGSGEPVHAAPDNGLREPATAPVMAAPEVNSIRRTLRARLAYLPQFAETSPC